MRDETKLGASRQLHRLGVLIAHLPLEIELALEDRVLLAAGQDDAQLEVILDLNLLNGGIGNGKGFPKKPHVQDQKLWKRVGQKFNEKNGHLECSLVKKVNIEGKFPGKLIRPNILEIPDFGRVHLAELIVSYHSFQLIMMRFELGCPTVGAMSASAGKVNGSGGGG